MSHPAHLRILTEPVGKGRTDKSIEKRLRVESLQNVQFTLKTGYKVVKLHYTVVDLKRAGKSAEEQGKQNTEASLP